VTPPSPDPADAAQRTGQFRYSVVDVARFRGLTRWQVINPSPDPGGLLGPAPAHWRWTVWGSIWLVFLAGAFQQAFAATEAWQRVVGILGLTSFCLAYALGPPRLLGLPRRDPRRWGFPLFLLLLATALLPVTGQDGLTAYVFVAVVMILCWPPRQAFLGIVGLLVVAPILEVVAFDRRSPFGIDLTIATASLAVWGLVSVLRRNRELADAREELARLAVSEERLRFARDLHDIVGHSLTAISVKADLAGRLIGHDDDRAGAEIADVQQVARDALRDVRATVRGYRDVSLAGELASARSVLAAAGISAEIPTAIDGVPDGNRELFGWVVREGVTNVVRHSRATRVCIAVTRSTVEVTDDGPASLPRPAGGGLLTDDTGTGLAGLRERLRAVGGTLTVGPDGDGGWRLRAEVPS
jgi:two-component system sensor histidine kinase DesK